MRSDYCTSAYFTSVQPLIICTPKIIFPKVSRILKRFYIPYSYKYHIVLTHITSHLVPIFQTSKLLLHNLPEFMVIFTECTNNSHCYYLMRLLWFSRCILSLNSKRIIASMYPLFNSRCILVSFKLMHLLYSDRCIDYLLVDALLIQRLCSRCIIDATAMQQIHC